MSLCPTTQLLIMIGTPFELGKVWEEPEESEELYQYAFKNRIGLLYLLALKERDKLNVLIPKYEELDIRARETLVTAARAAKVLNDVGVNYVIFKTFRPYPATPNDVDIVCIGSNSTYEEALFAVKEAGYIELSPAPMQFLFGDPRGRNKIGWDKRRGTYYVDVYKAPATDYFIYLSPRKIKKQIVETEINGEKVKILRPEVELAAILMHSVFPEMSYGLESFYTTCYYFSRWDEDQFERFIRFSRSSHIVLPVRAHLSITATLHEETFGYVPEKLTNVLKRIRGIYKPEVECFRKSGFKAPYKFRFTTFFGTFLAKLAEPSSATSLGVQGFHMLNPKFAKEVFATILKKGTQETYAHM